ncbi:MAG: hypothetical protein CMJ81_18940 [Planctomycetaceae bacterium]|nr:hypothetical protein [Planctomycetaceae bacterium]
MSDRAQETSEFFKLEGAAVMERNGSLALQTLRLIVISFICVCGCAQLRLPRIDPTGQRLFLPGSEPATIVTPELPFGRSGAAYQTPPMPPPCPQGVLPAATPPVIPAARYPADLPGARSTVPGDTSRLALRPELKVVGPTTASTGVLVNPARIIAPVGSLVVLKAGLSGQDGKLISGEPIQWIMSQESVGYFVSVGEIGASRLRIVPRLDWGKVSNSLAMGQTGQTAQVVTRGTASRSDDVLVLKGESWLTLASSSVGVSRVTAHAADSRAWDSVQQTAVVHWVDVEATFAPATQAKVGRPVDLTTSVTRASTGEPLGGAIVRYELVGDTAARFAPLGSRYVEIPTNHRGRAVAQLISRGQQAGTSDIAIQVIQAPARDNDFTRLVLAQGSTQVSWSTAKLALRVVGPDVCEVDTTMTYRLDVSNAGDLPANGVVLSEVMPEGLTLVNSNPAAEFYGNRIQWRLGDLQGGGHCVIEFRCQAECAGSYQHYFHVQDENGLECNEVLSARVVDPTLKLEVSGPQIAEVGREVQFRVVARNLSQQPIQNVIVHDRFDEGLEHANAVSPIQRQLGTLEAGQSRRFAVTFTVQQAGTLCHSLELTADGGHHTSKRVCLQATPARAKPHPAITVKKTGPQSRELGKVAEFLIEVVNTGNVPLLDVRVDDHYPSGLRPFQATRGWVVEGKALVWSIPQLPVGSRSLLRIRCDCLEADPNTCTHVTVSSGHPVVTVSNDACMEIYDRAGIVELDPADRVEVPANRDGVREVPDQASGGPELTLTDLSDPVRQGRQLVYLLRIFNNREVSDRNLQLTLEIPPELKLEKIQGPVKLDNRYPSTGRTIHMEPISELRAADEVTFRIEVIAVEAGPVRLQASLESLLSDSRIVVEEDTTIFEE